MSNDYPESMIKRVADSIIESLWQDYSLAVTRCKKGRQTEAAVVFGAVAVSMD